MACPLLAHSAAPEACDSALGNGLYLRHLHCLGLKDDPVSLQLRATALSFLGQNAQAQLLMTQSEGELAQSVAGEKARLPALKRTDAIEELVRLARGHRVVMLNEAHHEARHRVFALELATELRKLGFTHLALEALNHQGVPKKGYATLKAPTVGFYTAEPQFGNFIRHAVEMGFTLVPYEASGGTSIDEREKGQARNLAAILKNEPGAKVLVYAGFAHISERDSASGKGYMAKYLAMYSGVDPLTIDQVGGTAHTPIERSDQTWLAVSASLGNGPAVFRKQRGGWLVSSNYDGRVDITVFHPETVLNDGRPDWLLKNRIKHVVKNPVRHGATVVRAVVPGEINGVPVDQILIDSSESPAVLVLPKGSYRIESETLDHGVVGLYDITL